MRVPADLQGEALAVTALAHFAAGSLGEAERSAEALRRELGAHPFVLWLLGAIALGQGQVRGAIEYLRAATQGAAATSEALFWLARAYRADGAAAAALEVFPRAVECAAADADELTALAARALEQGWHEEAESCCRTLLARHPARARSWFLLGGALHGQQRFAEAVDCYDRCLELDPEAERAYLQAGAAQQALGLYVDALESYLQLLRRRPDHAEARLEAGRMRFHFGQYALAADDCGAALGAGPGAPPRLLRARAASLREWCAMNASAYASISLPRPTGLALPRVIPQEEAGAWRMDRDMMNEIFVARVAGAEVFPQHFTVLAPDHKLFLDGLVTTPRVFPLKGTLVKYSNGAGELLLAAPPRRRVQRGPCVLLGGHSNYFHWVYEAVARMLLIEPSDELRKLPLIMYRDLAVTQLAMLDALGIGPERRVFLGDDESLLCDELYVPSLVTNGYVIPPNVVQFLRARFAPLVPARPERRRIYISRNRYGRRRLANEAELLPLLEASGFETVYPERLSLAEQLAAFASAEAIFAIDGAALANLFIAREGAKVGVIATSGLYIPHYYYVSHALGHEFSYLHGLPLHASHERLAHRDLYLPRDRLEQFLQTL